MLVALLLGCAPSPCADGFGRDAAGACVPLADDGAAADSAGGLDSAPPADPGGARLALSGPIDCADPSARADAPFVEADLGDDWLAQNADGAMAYKLGGGVSALDVSGDGLIDYLLPQVGDDQLYIGQPDGSVSDETAARWPEGVAANTASISAADVDGDRDWDLLLCTLEGSNRLLLNDGAGYFSDHTEAAGLGGTERACMASSWGDLDGDGDLDLFTGNYRNCATEDADRSAGSAQVLWENQGDGTFVEISDRLPGEAMAASIMRLGAILDLDGDLDQDLYLITDALDESGEANCLYPNQLYLNEGGALADASADSGLAYRMGGMGLGVGDVNGDGLPDMLLPDTGDILFLESLSPGIWYETTLSRGLGLDVEGEQRYSGWGTDLTDLDNDGLLDGVMGYGYVPQTVTVEGNYEDQPDALYHQQADGTFLEVAAAWGVDDASSTRGLTTLDVNGDGFPDLLKRALDGPAKLYLARCGEGAWLDVYLEGPAPNTAAIGAVVRLRHGDVTRTRWIHLGANGLNSTHQPHAHFGLGGVEWIDELTVIWPDGQVSAFADLEPRQRVTITREE